LTIITYNVAPYNCILS